MSGGFLRSPRVRVLWGDINLSAYDGPSKGAPEVFTLDTEKGGPIVYDVQVDLNAEGEGPTGEMKWDPTGPGIKAYEWFLSQDKYMKSQITVEFFYPRGKKVVFYYAWAGQSISYGNDMAVTVKLQSELAGLVNANTRSTAQAFEEDKGAGPDVYVKRAQKQFGLEKYKGLVAISDQTQEYWKKVKLLNGYGNDWTFGANINNLAKQTGDISVATNIGGAKIVLYSPWSWKDPKGKQQVALNAFTEVKSGEAPKVEKIYGYLLGPSIINTIQRTSVWKPPQQDNTGTPGTQSRATQPRDQQTGQFITAAEEARRNAQAAAARTPSPQGVSGGRANPAIQNKDNPYGPDRQNANNQEQGSELSMSTFMCPVLVGIKPRDILYVPSLTGKFIEDWIVKSVGYSQNDGRVELNIQATRTFGISDPMNAESAKEFKKFAEDFGLTGTNATLEAWDRYAWSLPEEGQGATTPTASSSSRYDTSEIDNA